MSSPSVVTGLVVTGAFFFALGAYYQNNNVWPDIHERNSHAYYIRNKLFSLLGLIGGDEESDAENETVHESEILKYGFPNTNDIRINRNCVASFDHRNSSINWMCERLEGRNARPDDASTWRTSQSTKSHTSAGQDITGSIDESEAARMFFMFNIKPFLGHGFNLHVWERLLGYANDMANQHRSLYVYTGSIYMPSEMKANRWYLEFQPANGSQLMAVPTHFFKIIVVDTKAQEHTPYAEAFVVPNRPLPNSTELRSLLTDLRDIENATGLKFFDGLERNFVNDQANSLSRQFMP